MAHSETSDAVSSMAGRYLRFGQDDLVALDQDGQADLVTAIRAMAASCLRQDEHKGPRPDAEPSAGTSAYQMLADVEKANVETTETLIHMIAATVMTKLIGDDLLAAQQAGEALSVTFSPQDMDRMFLKYDMDATRDGMLTTVRIIPKTAAETHPPTSFYTDPHPLDSGDAEPQVTEHVFDRPVWAIRYYDKDGTAYLANMQDRRDAERHLSDYDTINQPDPTIENRCCLHVECPSEGCRQTEATSED